MTMNNKELFENFLKTSIDGWKIDVPAQLSKGIEYSLFGGGKRIRPIMFLESYSVFDEINESALQFAAGIECYHTFTLVHDDLPCMDDDDFRRGKPTSHKVFGEGQAVLIGDALQNLAYTFLIRSIKSHKNANKAIEALDAFNRYVGAEGLIGGQSVDIADDSYLSNEMIDFIYRHKTCDLICAAVKCGALMSGASSPDCENLTEFAYHFGYIFQLTDDLLDSGTKEEKSILQLKTKEELNVILNQHIMLAEKHLNKINGNISFFRKLLQNTVNRTY